MSTEDEYLVREILRRHEIDRAERKQREAKEALTVVMERVTRLCADYEKAIPRSKTSILMADEADLEEILFDPARRAKHQRDLMVLIVGYQNTSKDRQQVLGQVNDVSEDEVFLGTTARYYFDEETLTVPSATRPSSGKEDEWDKWDSEVEKSIAWCSHMVIKLGKTQEQIANCLISYANNKGGKLKKKLDVALNQAKADISSLSSKLVATQNESDDLRARMIEMVKELEARRAENAKLRKDAESHARDQAIVDAMREVVSDKEAKIEELQRTIVGLEMDVTELRAQREGARQEAEEQLAELEGKLSQVELLLLKKKARLAKTKSAMNSIEATGNVRQYSSAPSTRKVETNETLESSSTGPTRSIVSAREASSPFTTQESSHRSESVESTPVPLPSLSAKKDDSKDDNNWFKKSASHSIPPPHPASFFAKFSDDFLAESTHISAARPSMEAILSPQTAQTTPLPKEATSATIMEEEIAADDEDDLTDHLESVVRELTERNAEELKQLSDDRDKAIEELTAQYKSELAEKDSRIYNLSDRLQQLQEQMQVIAKRIQGQKGEQQPISTIGTTQKPLITISIGVQAVPEVAEKSFQKNYVPPPLKKQPATTGTSTSKTEIVTIVERASSPFEGLIDDAGFDLFDEPNWSNVPENTLRARFAQFRDLARIRIRELETLTRSLSSPGPQDTEKTHQSGKSENRTMTAPTSTTMAYLNERVNGLLEMQTMTRAEADTTLQQMRHIAASSWSNFSNKSSTVLSKRLTKPAEIGGTNEKKTGGNRPNTSKPGGNTNSRGGGRSSRGGGPNENYGNRRNSSNTSDQDSSDDDSDEDDDDSDDGSGDDSDSSEDDDEEDTDEGDEEDDEDTTESEGEEESESLDDVSSSSNSVRKDSKDKTGVQLKKISKKSPQKVSPRRNVVQQHRSTTSAGNNATNLKVEQRRKMEAAAMAASKQISMNIDTGRSAPSPINRKPFCGPEPQGQVVIGKKVPVERTVIRTGTGKEAVKKSAEKTAQSSPASRPSASDETSNDGSGSSGTATGSSSEKSDQSKEVKIFDSKIVEASQAIDHSGQSEKSKLVKSAVASFESVNVAKLSASRPKETSESPTKSSVFSSSSSSLFESSGEKVEPTTLDDPFSELDTLSVRSGSEATRRPSLSSISTHHSETSISRCRQVTAITKGSQQKIVILRRTRPKSASATMRRRFRNQSNQKSNMNEFVTPLLFRSFSAVQILGGADVDLVAKIADSESTSKTIAETGVVKAAAQNVTYAPRSKKMDTSEPRKQLFAIVSQSEYESGDYGGMNGSISSIKQVTVAPLTLETVHQETEMIEKSDRHQAWLEVLEVAQDDWTEMDNLHDFTHARKDSIDHFKHHQHQQQIAGIVSTFGIKSYGASIVNDDDMPPTLDIDADKFGYPEQDLEDHQIRQDHHDGDGDDDEACQQNSRESDNKIQYIASYETDNKEGSVEKRRDGREIEDNLTTTPKQQRYDEQFYVQDHDLHQQRFDVQDSTPPFGDNERITSHCNVDERKEHVMKIHHKIDREEEKGEKARRGEDTHASSSYWRRLQSIILDHHHMGEHYKQIHREAESKGANDHEQDGHPNQDRMASPLKELGEHVASTEEVAPPITSEQLYDTTGVSIKKEKKLTKKTKQNNEKIEGQQMRLAELARPRKPIGRSADEKAKLAAKYRLGDNNSDTGDTEAKNLSFVDTASSVFRVGAIRLAHRPTSATSPAALFEQESKTSRPKSAAIDNLGVNFCPTTQPIYRRSKSAAHSVKIVVPPKTIIELEDDAGYPMRVIRDDLKTETRSILRTSHLRPKSSPLLTSTRPQIVNRPTSGHAAIVRVSSSQVTNLADGTTYQILKSGSSCHLDQSNQQVPTAPSTYRSVKSTTNNPLGLPRWLESTESTPSNAEYYEGDDVPTGTKGVTSNSAQNRRLRAASALASAGHRRQLARETRPRSAAKAVQQSEESSASLRDVLGEFQKSYDGIVQLGSKMLSMVQAKDEEIALESNNVELRTLADTTEMSNYKLANVPDAVTARSVSKGSVLFQTTTNAVANATVTRLSDSLGGLPTAAVGTVGTQRQEVEIARQMTNNVNNVLNSLTTVFDQILAIQQHVPPHAEDEQAEWSRPSTSHQIRPGSAYVAKSELEKLNHQHETLLRQLDLQRSDFERRLSDQSATVANLKETIDKLKANMNQMAAIDATIANQPTGEIDLSGHPVMFTRLDLERNTRALQMAAGQNRLSMEQLEDAIWAMQNYVELPARRLLQLATGSSAGTTTGRVPPPSDMALQKQIEEAKVSIKAARRIEKAGGVSAPQSYLSGDVERLAAERAYLAQDIMIKLQDIERDAGIFLIKPYFSFPGKQILGREQYKAKTSRPIKEFLHQAHESATPKPLQVHPPPNTAGQPPAPSLLASRQYASENQVQFARRTGVQPSSVVSSPSLVEGTKAPTVAVVAPMPTWNSQVSSGASVQEPTNGRMTPLSQHTVASTSRLEAMDLKRYVISQNVVSAAFPAALRDAAPPGSRTARCYYGLTRDAPVIRLSENQSIHGDGKSVAAVPSRHQETVPSVLVATERLTTPTNAMGPSPTIRTASAARTLTPPSGAGLTTSVTPSLPPISPSQPSRSDIDFPAQQNGSDDYAEMQDKVTM